MEERDRRRRGIRDSEPHELWEFRVEELAVEARVRVLVRSRGEVQA